jgi:hypothetical protein
VADATTAAKDADVANKAEMPIKEAANKEAGHSNHESIAGRMAYAPMTVPPAPKTGHQTTATMQNMQNGSTQQCFWL